MFKGRKGKGRSKNINETGKFSFYNRAKEGLGNFLYLAAASVMALIGAIVYKVYKAYRKQYYKSKLATLPYSNYQDKLYYERCLKEMS